ncbi:hypothetical protein QOZ80_7AG0567570 [Eleusine coracana subsp. coracana]|nr:hypothetical protein QOZ80_7AG0567460 [Eleusine coracana subsp. coracana]KAK3127052.1 hypothetical protein QOZ80_7AG0567570 [Eleusine coracana subsp. coracana]
MAFSPSNDELVDRYLRAKLSGLAKSRFFHDADVCSARPDDLVRDYTPARVQSRDAGDGKQWYFFSPVRFLGGSLKKRSRTIDGTGDTECWHAEGRTKPVEGSAAGGYMTKFSYHVKNKIGPKKMVEKPGWIMAEYSFKDTMEDGDMVLCKIYKSPRCSKARSSSGRKRKAADDLDLEEEAMPSRRKKKTAQTEEEEDEDAMLFAGDTERDLEVAESSSTGLHWTEEDGVMPLASGEMLHYYHHYYVDQESQQQLGLPLPVVYGEFMSLMMAPDEDLFGDNQQQQHDAGLHAPLTGYLDDLLLNGSSSMFFPHPGGGAPDVLCT